MPRYGEVAGRIVRLTDVEHGERERGRAGPVFETPCPRRDGLVVEPPPRVHRHHELEELRAVLEARRRATVVLRPRILRQAGKRIDTPSVELLMREVVPWLAGSHELRDKLEEIRAVVTGGNDITEC